MMIKHIDKRLDQWGQFFGGGFGAKGFPKSSPETKAIDGGGAVDVADGYVPEGINEVEQAVRAMDGEQREVVKAAYMTAPPREDQAKRLSKELGRRVSPTKFKEMINYSHHFIAGRISLDRVEKSVDKADR